MDQSAFFSPYKLSTLDLPNRVVMAAMTRSRSPNGIPTEEVAAYYRRRAEQGVGLIITEAAAVERQAAVNEPDVPYFHGEAALAAWKRVVDEVHAAGGRIAPQLWHVGLKRSRVAPDWTPPAPYEGPSGLSASGESVGNAMSEADVADTIAAFGRAAADAERLGFDAVELHGAHGYLIDQFFLAKLNLRTDQYGGTTLVERSRFAVDVLRAVRANVSSGFPVILRLSQSVPGGGKRGRLAETPEEMGRWLGVLVEAGADAFHLSQARYWEPAFPEADGGLNLAGWAKKLTGKTAITVGSVGLSTDVYASFAGEDAQATPIDPVVERLSRGEFDLVAVGRPLLQDPAWLSKTRRGSSDKFKVFSPEAFATLS